MRRRFVYEYEHTSPNNIRFEYSDERPEHLDAWVAPDGAPNLAVNASGALMLAKLLAQFAQCSFSKGFHLHLHRDFDADRPTVLTLVKVEDVESLATARPDTEPEFGNDPEETLTVREAYQAMAHFLDDLYERTGSDELAVLLSGMSLLRDGTPADPAFSGDWARAVEQARSGAVLALTLTRSEPSS